MISSIFYFVNLMVSRIFDFVNLMVSRIFDFVNLVSRILRAANTVMI